MSFGDLKATSVNNTYCVNNVQSFSASYCTNQDDISTFVDEISDLKTLKFQDRNTEISPQMLDRISLLRKSIVQEKKSLQILIKSSGTSTTIKDRISKIDFLLNFIALLETAERIEDINTICGKTKEDIDHGLEAISLASSELIKSALSKKTICLSGSDDSTLKSVHQDLANNEIVDVSEFIFVENKSFNFDSEVDDLRDSAMGHENDESSYSTSLNDDGAEEEWFDIQHDTKVDSQGFTTSSNPFDVDIYSIKDNSNDVIVDVIDKDTASLNISGLLDIKRSNNHSNNSIINRWFSTVKPNLFSLKEIYSQIVFYECDIRKICDAIRIICKSNDVFDITKITWINSHLDYVKNLSNLDLEIMNSSDANASSKDGHEISDYCGRLEGLNMRAKELSDYITLNYNPYDYEISDFEQMRKLLVEDFKYLLSIKHSIYTNLKDISNLLAIFERRLADLKIPLTDISLNEISQKKVALERELLKLKSMQTDDNPCKQLLISLSNKKGDILKDDQAKLDALFQSILKNSQNQKSNQKRTISALDKLSNVAKDLFFDDLVRKVEVLSQAKRYEDLSQKFKPDEIDTIDEMISSIVIANRSKLISYLEGFDLKNLELMHDVVDAKNQYISLIEKFCVVPPSIQEVLSSMKGSVLNTFPSNWRNEQSKVPLVRELIMKYQSEAAKPIDQQAFVESLKEYIALHASLIRSANSIGYVEKRILLSPTKICVRADIHGDLKSLMANLMKFKEEGVLDENFKCTPNSHLVFLGDYSDRGSKSLQVLQLLMSLKIQNFDQVTLIRGNHESSSFNQPGVDDLDYQSFIYDATNLKHFEGFYKSLPLNAYIGQKNSDDSIEYVMFSHGLLEPSLDTSSFLANHEKNFDAMEVFPSLIDHENGQFPLLSLRVRSVKLDPYVEYKDLENSDPSENKEHYRFLHVVKNIVNICKKDRRSLDGLDGGFPITAFNWGDISRSNTILGPMGMRRWALSSENISNYMQLISSDKAQVKLLFRGHQHKKAHHLYNETLVATTLPVSMFENYTQLGFDSFYLLTTHAKYKNWTKKVFAINSTNNETYFKGPMPIDSTSA